jgi:RimJ/RimL family protein N-acetyltransferase
VRLRLIEEADLERVRELRNANRRWFFHDEEIVPEQHRTWFAGLGATEARFYVIEEDGAVVGTISATTTAAGCEIGNLILGEAYRGRGLMRRAIEQLTAEPGRYFCEVKPDNEHSLRVFERAGFRPTHVVLERIVD